MSKTKELALEILGGLGDALEAVGDQDGLEDARKIYNRRVNQIQRKVWKRHLKPLLEKHEGKDELEDLADLLELIELLVRRFA